MAEHFPEHRATQRGDIQNDFCFVVFKPEMLEHRHQFDGVAAPLGIMMDNLGIEEIGIVADLHHGRVALLGNAPIHSDDIITFFFRRCRLRLAVPERLDNLRCEHLIGLDGELTKNDLPVKDRIAAHHPLLETLLLLERDENVVVVVPSVQLPLCVASFLLGLECRRVKVVPVLLRLRLFVWRGDQIHASIKPSDTREDTGIKFILEVVRLVGFVVGDESELVALDGCSLVLMRRDAVEHRFVVEINRAEVFLAVPEEPPDLALVHFTHTVKLPGKARLQNLHDVLESVSRLTGNRRKIERLVLGISNKLRLSVQINLVKVEVDMQNRDRERLADLVPAHDKIHLRFRAKVSLLERIELEAEEVFGEEYGIVTALE